MILFLCVISGGAIAIALLVTADRWLVGILNALDRVLTAAGFGKWSAGLLTRAEEWARGRKAGRRR
jgi:hypothetical protein